MSEDNITEKDFENCIHLLHLSQTEKRHIPYILLPIILLISYIELIDFILTQNDIKLGKHPFTLIYTRDFLKISKIF
ncbi:MAG: hypothetical protein ACFFA0_01150 [Promethearchaeota archaeon]